ncbi:hypothetical protein COB21_01920 [Candidatus Aerophobetes bacterium]|uniref:Queuosine precursor transporter n=1 Tax=Aerophobetes bacterium TaxID=2030807 RepID=A0A2A4X7H2_UNCAE|nr:MAG: hypothetical protein COB21_01920 [Candidatus Aerophobetes bacterium]
MFNESLLLLHLVALLSLIFLALKLGRVYLILVFCLQVLLSNLFVIKQIELFSFHVTCCDVYTVGSILTLNLIQEYFGKKAAKTAVITLCFSTLFFIVMSQLHLFYIPSMHDTTATAFQTILGISPRIMTLSIIIALSIARLDIELFSFLKRFAFFKNRLGSRFGILTLFTQLIDTALFTFIALMPILAHPGHIMLVSYLAKVGVIISMTPALYFFKKWVPIGRSYAN